LQIPPPSSPKFHAFDYCSNKQYFIKVIKTHFDLAQLLPT